MSFPAGVKPFAERQFPKTICMFDVDGTLSPARLSASPEMLETLKKLREKCVIAFVGGSDLKKIAEQLCPNGGNGEYPLAAATSDYGGCGWDGVDGIDGVDVGPR